MADLHHLWGGGLQLSATGDLLLVDGAEKGRQRVIRRLLSNPATDDSPGDLLFHPEYGGGLPRQIGEGSGAETLEARVRRQMFMEAVVSREPPPVILARPVFGGASIRVAYTDAETGEAAAAGFTVER